MRKVPWRIEGLMQLLLFDVWTSGGQCATVIPAPCFRPDGLQALSIVKRIEERTTN